MLIQVVLPLGDVSATPDVSGLPGSNVLQQLVNGAEAWALAIALIGAFVGAALWAIASHAHNPHYAARGPDGGGDLRRVGARDRVGPGHRQLLRAPRHDRPMNVGSRTATVAAFCLVGLAGSWALASAPASALGLGGTGLGGAGLGGAGLGGAGLGGAGLGGAAWVAPAQTRRCRTRRRAAGAAVGEAIDAWVLGSAHGLLDDTATAFGDTTSPQLRTTWFSSTYWRMAAIAARPDNAFPVRGGGPGRDPLRPRAPRPSDVRSTCRSRCSASRSPRR